jgi:hypothetical protein
VTRLPFRVTGSASVVILKQRNYINLFVNAIENIKLNYNIIKNIIVEMKVNINKICLISFFPTYISP